MKIKINNVPGYSGTIKVETDQAGTPIAKFWRRRLEDATIDKCIEIVKPKKRMIK